METKKTSRTSHRRTCLATGTTSHTSFQIVEKFEQNTLSFQFTTGKLKKLVGQVATTQTWLEQAALQKQHRPKSIREYSRNYKNQSYQFTVRGDRIK